MEDTMNITSAKYQIHNDEKTSIRVTIDGFPMTVPLDTGNRHYAEILRQVNAGTLTVEDAD
tara:strand:+ start:315 stop:497 length:183 start_codon:yes stop_codon:yes gene_type:complete